MTDAWLWPVGLALLGAILGSFVATLVVRWPTGRSVVAGRSACDTCDHPVRAIDLVPLWSFARLRGRCRACGAAIDPRHLVIEALAAVIGATAGYVVPGPEGAAGAVFGWLLLALGALDLAAMWLPDRLTAMLALGGALAGAVGWAPTPADRVIGGVAGFLGLWAVAAVYRLVRGRDGLGGGDPKLLGAIGLWLGWRLLPAVLMVACLVGLGAVAWRLLLGRRIAGDDAMPLGSLLAVAAYPAWLVMVAWPM